MNTSLVIIKIHINFLDCILSASSSVMPMLACGRDTLQHLMLLADSSPPNQDPLCMASDLPHCALHTTTRTGLCGGEQSASAAGGVQSPPTTIAGLTRAMVLILLDVYSRLSFLHRFTHLQLTFQGRNSESIFNYL